MKKTIQQLMLFFLLLTGMQSYSSPVDPVKPSQAKQFVTYRLVYTFEGSYYDEYLYIEYYSFKVVYDSYLPYNMTVNYSVFWQNNNGGSGEDVYNAWAPAGSSFTNLGTYETYYHEQGGYMETKYLVVNSVS